MMNFKLNQKVFLKLILTFDKKSKEELMVEASIVRIQESDSIDKQLISLMFKKLSDQSRQKIVKYTLEQQRQQIQAMKG